MTQENEITINDQKYDVNTLPDSIKSAISVYNKITTDLRDAEFEVVKCKAAAQLIGKQIADAVEALQLNKQSS